MEPPSPYWPHNDHRPGQASRHHVIDAFAEVLVDCPQAQGLYTYRVPSHQAIQPGDIVSVPFGSRQLGAVVIRQMAQAPTDLDIQKIHPIQEVISQGFFPTEYWVLLQRVADYYCTPLMQVVKAALPPGLLGRSQRRIRLKPDSIPDGALVFLQPAAQHILEKLQSSKSQDYTWTYLRRNLRGAKRGLKDLLQRGWVDSYLEPPSPVRPKTQQAVTLTGVELETLTTRQQDVLDVLKRNGGDLWLTELLQRCRVSSSVVHTLAKKGAVVVQSREVLRLNQADHPSGASNALSPLKHPPKTLTPDQQRAVEAIAHATQSHHSTSILLHGVTGSGKTEVYLQAIAPILTAGKSALVLVPEIGLTPQLTDRFVARFGDRVQVYHSGLSDGERYDTWRQLLHGTPCVIIGTRSAIFVPMPNLGILVLDEEHDSSFKQDRPAPCYHARTVAQWRSELACCPLILGTATPSLETWVQVGGTQNAQKVQEIQGLQGEQGTVQHPQPSVAVQSALQDPQFLYLPLPTRVHARPLPPVNIVDMRREFADGHRSIFSRDLLTALHQLKATGQQGILFIHRRGHSTFVSCRSCGHVLECADCDVSLSYHHTQAEATPYLRCHYCGAGRSHPEHCPSCHSPYLKHFGSGTQRVTQELEKHLPELRYIRYDSDTTRTKGSHRALMNQFAQGDADILVGTQMLTKGIDIPHVTLVGVIAADGLLHMADYRAGERTYQTLTQVAGRAGRGDHPGQVIIQTYVPSHPILMAIKHKHSYAKVADHELEQRKTLHYPPYRQLIVIKISGADPTVVQQTAEQIASHLLPEKRIAQQSELQSGQQPEQQPQPTNAIAYELLGPAPAAILRVARRFRWQILLKCPIGQTQALAKQLQLSRLRTHCPSGVSLTVDIDPLNLL
ncbi:MAG: primosomal protein N' [Symploca sp. SIO2B6]|nr:primosomal protein N' [Symploca sp. SIO2B6]